MNCEETQRLVHAYIDAELDVVNSLEVEQHLRGCPACTRDYESYQTLRAVIRRSSLDFQAPVSLQKRVRLTLPKADRSPRKARLTPWRWLNTAALVLLVLGGLGFWSFIQLRSSSAEDNNIAQAVVNSHERSLVDNHQVDILSTDQNTIKTWFENKLGYSPPVIDLTPQGFSLIGGRLDFLNKQAIAAIIYKKGNHVIDLFVWPATQNADIHTFSLQGYYLTHWTKYGMDCWAVADLDEGELQQFAHLIGQHFETVV